MVFTAERARATSTSSASGGAGGEPRLWEGRPASRMMLSSPFRRGLCTGSSFQQTLRQRMREVSPSCPAGCLTPATSRAAATSSPGVASPLTSGRVRKRGGGAGGPRAAQGRARVPTKTQAGAAAPDGRPPAAAVRGVQLPLAALHDGSLPQGQRLPAREVRAALPSPPPPPPSMPTCGLTHAVLGVRPLPSGWHPAAPDVTLPRPARAGSTSQRASTCCTATTTRTSASAELRLSGDR